MDGYWIDYIIKRILIYSVRLFRWRGDWISFGPLFLDSGQFLIR